MATAYNVYDGKKWIDRVFSTNTADEVRRSLRIQSVATEHLALCQSETVLVIS